MGYTEKARFIGLRLVEMKRQLGCCSKKESVTQTPRTGIVRGPERWPRSSVMMIWRSYWNRRHISSANEALGIKKEDGVQSIAIVEGEIAVRGLRDSVVIGDSDS